MIELAFREQIFQRHLHQHDEIFLFRPRLAEENLARALQHVVRRVGDRAETAALDDDRFFVEDFRRLHGLAIRREHDRVGQALAHQLQAHQAVVDPRVGRSGELDHVHLDALRR